MKTRFQPLSRVETVLAVSTVVVLLAVAHSAYLDYGRIKADWSVKRGLRAAMQAKAGVERNAANGSKDLCAGVAVGKVDEATLSCRAGVVTVLIATEAAAGNVLLVLTPADNASSWSCSTDRVSRYVPLACRSARG